MVLMSTHFISKGKTLVLIVCVGAEFLPSLPVLGSRFDLLYFSPLGPTLCCDHVVPFVLCRGNLHPTFCVSGFSGMLCLSAQLLGHELW